MPGIDQSTRPIVSGVGDLVTFAMARRGHRPIVLVANVSNGVDVDFTKLGKLVLKLPPRRGVLVGATQKAVDISLGHRRQQIAVGVRHADRIGVDRISNVLSQFALRNSDGELLLAQRIGQLLLIIGPRSQLATEGTGRHVPVVLWQISRAADNGSFGGTIV